MGRIPGSPKAIPDEIENLIINWATEDNIHKLQDRESLAWDLQEAIQKRGQKVPTLDTLKAKISTARNQQKEPSDYPWSMSTLRDPKFSLPPDVIPYVVKVQQKQKSMVPFADVSIRQSQWIARLCKVVPNIDNLAIISWYYTLYERVTNKAGTPFDTTKPDSVLPNKDKVIEAFQDLLEAASFKILKPIFDDMAVTKLSENRAKEIDTIWLDSDNVIAVEKIPCKDTAGHKFYNHIMLKNLGLQSIMIPQLVNNGIIKKQKSYPSNIYITLRKPVMIEISPDELSQINNFLKSLARKTI